MKIPFFASLFFFVNACGSSGFAQDPLNFKVGDVTSRDFSITSSLVDSNTDAVVLADTGKVVMEGYQDGYRTIFQRFRRILILNKRGMGAATIKINFSVEDNGGRRLKGFKGCTYNLENGKVIRTAVENKDFFVDKLVGDEAEEKFSFPNVREGSIIEYVYSVKYSGFFQLHPWHMQGEYPVLYSRFTAEIPDIFNYVFLIQGKQPLSRTDTISSGTTIIAGPKWYEAHIHSTTWTTKDIPAIKVEPFTTTLDNYISSIKFQLSARPTSQRYIIQVLGSWESAAYQLMLRDRFGEPLSEENKWLKEPVGKVIAGCHSSLEASKRIFAYVRDNFKTTGYGMLLSPGMTLEAIFKAKSGTVGDINLLLIAMLRSAKVEADPLILSTRENGFTNPTYPIMENFNYVVVKAVADGVPFYLDASQPEMGFGRLPPYCYNGAGRVISKNNYAVFLQPDSLTESRMTSVFINNGEKDNAMEASFAIAPGYFESWSTRSELHEKTMKDYFKEQLDALPFQAVPDSSSGIDSLLQYDQPINIHYNIGFSLNGEDLVYFNPMLNAGLRINPFKSAVRSYPVELPYRRDETYVLNMEVPKGYRVDDMPKPVKVLLGDDGGFFEYNLSLNEDHILVKSRFFLKKAVFEPEDYQSLRDFFSFVVKKHGEEIVFRKIKK